MPVISSLGRALAITGEGVRLTHGGWLGKLVAAMAVLLTLVIAWYALYMPVTEHKQISYFVALIFPIGFLTTTISKSFTRLTWLDYLLAIVSFVGFMLRRDRRGRQPAPEARRPKPEA